MADRSEMKSEDPNRQQLLETVIADYIRMAESGSAPNQQKLLEWHPELADELQQFFEQRDRIKRLAEPVRNFATDLFQLVGPGRQISYVGNYELLEEIARGGMGVVYKARQTTLGRIVAVKMILAGRLASAEEVQRFQQEARMAANLQHANIVSIHEVGQYEGWHYFSMDYVEGRNLAAILRENVLPARQAVEYVRQMAEAIHYAHQQGTLHRDLKPGNILIDAQGDVRITDFGLSGRMEGDSDLTRTGQIVGTPSYMPPEQAQGKRALVGPGADVYALGAILYECVTGRAPFRADTPIQTIQQVIHVDAASPRLLNPAVPRDLETICLKCLEKEPHKRFGTAKLLADELGRFLRGEPIVARPPAILERGVKWVRRHPAAAGLVSLSLVSLISLVGMGVAQHYNQRLETANVMLEASNSNLERVNEKLQVRNDELKLASEKLEASNGTLEIVNGRLQVSNDQLKEATGKIEAEKANAEAQRCLARRYLYASQMALVERARQEGNIGRVMQLLRSVIPESPDLEDLRGFEWHHLWRLYNGEQSHLRGHKGAVTTVAFSPDDKLLASGSADGTIKLWNVINGKVWKTLTEHGVRVTHLAFNSDGSRMASGGFDGRIILWDMAEGLPLRTLEGHQGFVTSVVFSPDDARLASGSEDKTVRVWRVGTGETLLQFTEHKCMVSGVVFGMDGKRIASVGQDGQASSPQGEAFFWDSESGNVKVRLETADRTPWTCLCVSPDGKMLAACGNSPQKPPMKIQIWDWTGASLRALDSHDHVISSINFSPDGKRLLTASRDQTVKTWDIETGKELFTLQEEAPCNSAAFSPEALRIATGSDDGTIKLWAPPGNPPRVFHETRARINNVGFSQNGNYIAAVAGPEVLAWDIHRGTVAARWETPATLGRLAWSPCSDLIGIGGTVLTLKTGKRSDCELSGPHRTGGMGTAFTIDGKLLAGVIDTGTVGIWEVETGRRLAALRPESAKTCWSSCVAFSPDGYRLAIGSGADRYPLPGTMQVWNVKKQQVELTLSGFRDSVVAVAFSPDGSQLAAGIGDARGFSSFTPGEVRIWDAATGAELHRLRGHRHCVYAVSFSPDGQRLATAAGRIVGLEGGEVKFWDLRTGQEVGSLPAFARCVYGVAFSPCGRRIATAGGDYSVKIWDGTPLAEMPARE